MSVWIFEIALGVLLLYLSLRIFRAGTGKLLVGLGGRLAAAIVAGLAAQLVTWGVAALTRNFVAQFLSASFVALIVYIVLAGRLLKRARRDNDAIARKIDDHTPYWIDAALSIVAVLLFWLAALLTLELGGRLVAVSTWREKVQRESYVLRYFLQAPEFPEAETTPVEADAATQPAPPEDQEPLPEADEDILSAQRRLLSGAGRTLSQARSYVAQATGTEQFARQLTALRQIAKLSSEDSALLVRSNPDLLALLQDPTVNRVVHNERITHLIDRISEGSVTAIYQLGDEPDVQQLLEDPQVRDLIKRVDPAKLMQQLEEHKRSSRQQ